MLLQLLHRCWHQSQKLCLAMYCFQYIVSYHAMGLLYIQLVTFSSSDMRDETSAPVYCLVHFYISGLFFGFTLLGPLFKDQLDVPSCTKTIFPYEFHACNSVSTAGINFIPAICQAILFYSAATTIILPPLHRLPNCLMESPGSHTF